MPMVFHIDMKTSCILSSLIGLLLAQNAQAVITLYIDDANEQFWFEGIDTGIPYSGTKALT